MFERLKKIIRKKPSVNIKPLPSHIPPLLAHAFQAGCIAVENEQHEFARIVACFIFDTLDWVRIEFTHASIKNGRIEAPQGGCLKNSISFPATLEQLEAYVESYMLLDTMPNTETHKDNQPIEARMEA
jgi:hypothetical protein